MLSETHRRRLVERGLDPELALRMGMRTAPDGTAILFDYLVDGKIHNTKVRRGKGNMPWAKTGVPLSLWNVDCLQAPPAPDEVLIITEGEFDALALIQAGFTRVVSVPNGAPNSDREMGGQRFSYLFEKGGDTLLDSIVKFTTVVLAVDGDNPGQYLRDALAARIGDEKCVWVEWPEGCKDANEALQQHGPENLATMIWGAKRMWLDHVARLSDIPDAGPDEVCTVGYEMMDMSVEAGGVRIPRVGFMTVSGPANHGKSSWSRQLCWHLWKEQGLPFAITAYEESAKPVYLKEFRRHALGFDPKQASPEQLARVDIELDDALVVIQRAPDGSVTQEQLLANVEFAIRVYGSCVVLVDPANEIERDSNPEATGKLIMELKAIATKYRVLVICVAHPPADIARRKRAEDLWTLYDVESSRHWAGKSDSGWMLWRLGDATMLYLAKSKRFDEYGPRTLYKLAHDKATNRFAAVAKGDHLLKQIATDQHLGQQANGVGQGKAKPTYGGYTQSPRED